MENILRVYVIFIWLYVIGFSKSNIYNITCKPNYSLRMHIRTGQCWFSYTLCIVLLSQIGKKYFRRQNTDCSLLEFNKLQLT